jgi:peptidoglycan hydrolase-like protein with peptidoglycan-binding domain
MYPVNEAAVEKKKSRRYKPRCTNTGGRQWVVRLVTSASWGGEAEVHLFALVTLDGLMPAASCSGHNCWRHAKNIAGIYIYSNLFKNVALIDYRSFYQITPWGKTLLFSCSVVLLVHMTNKFGISQSFGVVAFISNVVVAVVVAFMGLVLVASTETAAAEPETVVEAPCVEITKTLRRGMRDEVADGQIAALQRFLGVEPVSGIFGPLTEAAVGQWQLAQGVVAEGTPETTGLGIVGPRTRAALGLLCGQAGTLPAPMNDGASADFYFDTTEAPVVVSPALSCPAGEVCGLMQLSGSMTSDTSVVLVELGDDMDTASVTYDPQTDTYTGSIDFSAVMERVAEQGESCPCVYPILPRSGVVPVLPGYEQWTYTLPVVAGQTYRLALFDRETGALLDYAVIAPTALATVRTTDDEVVAGARVAGTATTVDALVVRITTPDGETVYESKPVTVEDGRWWHRISRSLTASAYQIFLETPEGTPVFSAPYQP